MTTKNSKAADWESVLSGIPEARALEYGANRKIYREGDPAASILLLRQGTGDAIKEKIQLYLIKPSNYDDAGHVVRYFRGVLPSNALVCLASIAYSGIPSSRD